MNIVTRWEDKMPMPPGSINPFNNVQIHIGPGDKVTFEATMDDTFNHSVNGAIRAFRAWADYELEIARWRDLRVMRERHETVTVPPSWPVEELVSN